MNGQNYNAIKNVPIFPTILAILVDLLIWGRWQTPKKPPIAGAIFEDLRRRSTA
jgi:hypothetical protein